MSNSKKRKRLIKLNGPFCIYCNKIHNVKDLTIDHVLPKKHGGSNNIKNLALSCQNCNEKKGVLLLTQFLRAYEIKVTNVISKYL